jgi:hypothetical protein
MSTNFQQNRSETSEYAHNNPSAQFKERELSRRSDLLLAENAKWLARNHDKLISRPVEPERSVRVSFATITVRREQSVML